MDKTMVEKIKSNPKYIQLVSTRSKFAWKLAIIMLVIYYTFIMIIAFSPSILGTPIGEGITTLGIPVGIVIILIAFLLTGIYTKRANKDFDNLISEIKMDIRKDDE